MMNNEPLILLVDDDSDFAEIVSHVLESSGYRVVCSCDSEDALDRLEEVSPSLVITDLMMKSLSSGFSLARQIKERPEWRNIPVIIMTGAGPKRGLDFAPRSKEDLAAMRADAFLTKPAKPEELLARVRDLLDRRSDEGLPPEA